MNPKLALLGLIVFSKYGVFCTSIWDKDETTFDCIVPTKDALLPKPEPEKNWYNRAARGGWIVLRYSTRMVTDGTAIDEVLEVLNERAG